MIRWRVCDVVERFARNSDDVLRNCKVTHGLDREWKLLLRPAEHHLSNLTPLWANRNFGADARKSDDEPHLGQTRETNRNDRFKHSEIYRRIPGSVWLFPARAAAIPATWRNRRSLTFALLVGPAIFC